MADIAKAAGVSKNTVSLALKNSSQVSETTRQRVEREAARLGYRRNPVVDELMARLRQGGRQSFQYTIALINANRDPKAFQNHPTIPSYLLGCRNRAKELGYALDECWLHDPKQRGETLIRMFHARGIRGAILMGMMDENHLPDHFIPVAQQFPCVVTGTRTREPALHFAAVDHHVLALRAFEHVIALGYQRPALVLDPVIDTVVEGRFTAGFQIGQRLISRKNCIPPFYDIVASRRDPGIFGAWMRTMQPDVIFTLYSEIKGWLEHEGWHVPTDVGLIQLEWRAAQPEWAGMHQHNDLVGAVALDMLVGMLLRGEKGLPEFPRATLIGPTWINGSTVVAQAKQKNSAAGVKHPAKQKAG